MWRLHAQIVKRIALGLFVCLLLGTVAASAVPQLAARIDGKDILLEEIDALSHAKVERIRARLVELAREQLDRLVDLELGLQRTVAARVEVVPVSDAEIDTFRREHQEDFQGLFAPGAIPPVTEREAIRFYLQSQTRKTAETRIRSELRRKHRIHILLPQAYELEAALTPGRVIARVDNTEILAAALEREAALRFYRLRGELYRERRRNLDVLIERRLLEAEAQRRSVSLQELEETLRRPAPVSDAELEAFVAEQHAAGQKVTDPQRARPYLAFKKAYQHRSALLTRLRERASVDVYLEPPVRPRFALDIAGGVLLGSAAESTLVAFTNYRCRPCRATHRELDRLLGENPPPRIVLRDFVPVYDPVATEAAALARCAAAKGALVVVREALLSRSAPPFGRPWFSPQEFEALARRAGMSSQALRACTRSPDVQRQIKRDSQAARRLGFDEAPAFIAEGVPLSGMQSAEGLRRALEEGEREAKASDHNKANAL